jgi:hypothetical protein
LRRCILDQFSDAQLLKLNAADQLAVANRLADIDPQADVRLAVDCPNCEHAWSARFDIGPFLWAEINTWAQRLLADIHALAFAFGWSEKEILAMTAWRREIYLEMLRR